MRMRRLATVFGLAMLLAGPGPRPGLAQDLGSDALRALRHGRLVVWMVRPVSPLKGVRILGLPDQTPMTFQEQTSGSFGKSASDFGANAGSYGVSTTSATIARRPGAPATTATAPPVAAVAPADVDDALAAAQGYREQTASTLGQTAGSFGTEASNHGQTNGSFGQTASSYGTEASNHGQTAGSFGNSLSTIARAGEPVQAKERVLLEDEVGPTLRAQFPDLKLQFVSVDVRNLRAQLNAADSSKYPDVVILDGFAASWPGLPQDIQDVLYMDTSNPVSLQQRGYPDERLASRWLVTRRAQHAAAAHALSMYLEARMAAKTQVASGR